MLLLLQRNIQSAHRENTCGFFFIFLIHNIYNNNNIYTYVYKLRYFHRAIVSANGDGMMRVRRCSFPRG